MIGPRSEHVADGSEPRAERVAGAPRRVSAAAPRSNATAGDGGGPGGTVAAAARSGQSVSIRDTVASVGAPNGRVDRTVADATVIILAYTEERGALTCEAVESVLGQTLPPRELILLVEGNPELAARFRERFGGRVGSVPAITIVESDEAEDDEPAVAGDEGERLSYACHPRIGVERTKGVRLAGTEIVVFLDDDAAAEPDWLERLLAPFADPSVVAVGGAPLPVYAKPRPRWFPFEFDWIFGCAYAGLPTTTAPVLRLIGANMALRRESVLAVGGFRSLAEDLDMAHRLLERSPQNKLIYEPRAIVHHYVHADRLTWHYYWRRCFWASRSKVSIMRGLGAAANLRADRRFARRALTVGVANGMRDLSRGDVGGLLRPLATVLALGVSALGYAAGLIEWRLGARRRRA